MSLSKKDYELIAGALKHAYEAFDGRESEIESALGVEVAAINIARALSNDNPRFDKARFLAACGVRE